MVLGRYVAGLLIIPSAAVLCQASGGFRPQPKPQPQLSVQVEPQPRPGWIGLAVDSVVGGLRVRAVDPLSPGNAAGVVVGDTIVKVDDRNATLRELARSLAATSAGGVIRVLASRNGVRTERELAVRSAPRSSAMGMQAAVAAATGELLVAACRAADGVTTPNLPAAPLNGAPFAMERWCASSEAMTVYRGSDPNIRIATQIKGLYLLPLNDKLASYFGPSVTGFLIVDVRDGSEGATAGFEPGDVVTAVNGSAVSTLRSIHEALLEGKTARLEVVRKRQSISLVLPGDKK